MTCIYMHIKKFELSFKLYDKWTENQRMEQPFKFCHSATICQAKRRVFFCVLLLLFVILKIILFFIVYYIFQTPITTLVE